jgi:glyoxylase-like metal-dependent hydrolase (beta-lactamase superfamily II)
MESFTAAELFYSFENNEDFIILDVRNEEDYSRFSIEGPVDVLSLNIPYFDFIERPEESVAKVPSDFPVRVICAKQGSSEFVRDVLMDFGRNDVMYLHGGINTWGNVLIPKRINCEDSSYELWQFNRPGKASCSYGLIYGAEMYVFDPTKNSKFYIEFAESRGAKISHTFETHLQADYISGSAKIAEAVGATFAAHPGDFSGSVYDYRPLSDGDVFNFNTEGAPVVQVVHSPGHTPGSTTYVIDEKFMLSGDTVFIVSVGRPDLGNQVVAWAKTLYATLQERIMVMPDDLLVLPGHFTNWSKEADENNRIINNFGDVKRINEEIYGIEEEDDFVAYIEANMRVQPEIYNQIRKVNSGLLTPCDTEQGVMDLGKNECAASANSA